MEVHVNLLLPDNKAFSSHLTFRACADYKTLLLLITSWITGWVLPATPLSLFFATCVLLCCYALVTHLLCANFLLVDGYLFVGVEPCLRQSIWLQTHQLCDFPIRIVISGSRTLSLIFVGRHCATCQLIVMLAKV